jgi:hypothetical protein
MGFWNWLSDTSVFVSRDQCGPGWTKTMVEVSYFANMAIAISYLVIPVALGVVYWQKRNTITRKMNLALMFYALFILLCGMTHIGHFVVFRAPAYRLFTLIDVCTAIVSIISAFIVSPMAVPEALKFRTSDEWHGLLNQLNEKHLALVVAHAKGEAHGKRLEERLKLMVEVINSKLWAAERRTDIAELMMLIRTLKDEATEIKNGKRDSTTVGETKK